MNYLMNILILYTLYIETLNDIITLKELYLNYN